jgi:hypothetical protein
MPHFPENAVKHRACAWRGRGSYDAGSGLTFLVHAIGGQTANFLPTLVATLSQCALPAISAMSDKLSDKVAFSGDSSLIAKILFLDIICRKKAIIAKNIFLHALLALNYPNNST